MDKLSAEKLIRQRIAEGEELRRGIMLQSEADGWANKVEHSVRRVLDADEDWIGRFLHIRGGVSSQPARRVELAQQAVTRTLDKLNSLIDIIRESDDGDTVAPPTTKSPAVPAAAPARASNEVFIVHGHEEGPRESVARFLESLGLRPVILHEQASRGQTIIEKVETHSDVGFAVVLLTADDVGGRVGAEASPRARQNVILELGYFIGRLGRQNVCALVRQGVEIPSDFSGVVYVELAENDAWKIRLARELRESGYEIDWNKVMA